MRMHFTSPGNAGVSEHSEASSSRAVFGVHTHGSASAGSPQVAGLRHAAPVSSRQRIQAAVSYDAVRITDALAQTQSSLADSSETARNKLQQLITSHGLAQHWVHQQNTGPHRAWDVITCSDPRQPMIFYCPASGEIRIDSAPSASFFSSTSNDGIQP